MNATASAVYAYMLGHVETMGPGLGVVWPGGAWHEPMAHLIHLNLVRTERNHKGVQYVPLDPMWRRSQRSGILAGARRVA